ncbi:MAG TPA: hypothetical protein PLZ37_07530 [Nitrospira sp.]|nr:hypothetical protein [Nitrospira sp.]
MSLDIETEKQRLAQGDFLKWTGRQISPAEMVTVYLDDKADDHNIGMYCALIPNDQIERSLADPSWDLQLGHGLPQAMKWHDEGKVEITYHRYGSHEHIEPLVICRDFHGIRQSYQEVSEEFRHFHRLYYERKMEQYLKIDDSGNEQVVAIVEPQRVQIRLQEIRQFLAIKDMHLALMFDCRQHSMESLGDLNLQEVGTDHRDGLLVYSLTYGDFGGLTGLRAFSRLLGKRLIPPFSKEKSGFWGFARDEPKKRIDFIIGIDEDGTEINHTSDPAHLSNYFGANPGAPHYLTPVHFRKQVLDKYYQASKYSVEDGYLRCGGLWGMMIDNHHDDRVAVWLGDLGRDLPYEEQLHWRSYNIPPVGGVSQTFFKRQLLAQATDSDRPEHIFKSHYNELAEMCQHKLGWKLLLPLSPDDLHYFEGVRVPAGDEQKDFDDLTLALAKILVDSLNEKEFNQLIPLSHRADIKGGIARLEKVLVLRDAQGYEEHMKFLRNLQNLRSSGSAHRKGDNYLRVAREFGIESSTLRSVFEGILTKAVAFLDFLHGLVERDLFVEPFDAGSSRSSITSNPHSKN